MFIYVKETFFTLTFVLSYACCAVHSALVVGFDSANMIGISAFCAICFSIAGVNAPPTVEQPNTYTTLLLTNIIPMKTKDEGKDTVQST